MSIILNINPCSYGKCNFCGYNKLTKFKEPDLEEYKELLAGELIKAKNENRYIKIFNGGSWFCEEVPEWIKIVTYNFLKKNNYKWLRVENRVDKINWEEVKELKKDGFDLTISWGVESINENILLQLNKGITQNKISSALRIGEEIGIKNLIYLMVGLPNTTNKDYFETIDLLSKFNYLDENVRYIQEIVTLICVPIRNTYFYDELWLKDKWRMLTKEEWKECKEYIRNKFPDIPLGFEQYHWRYIHGKVRSECYKRKNKNLDASTKNFDEKI